MAAPDPPIVCTLGPEVMPVRLREWAAVLDRVEERRVTPDGVELRLPRDPDVLAALAAVAAKEVECCSFFTFTLTVDARAAWLAVAAPPDGVAIVRELFGPVRRPDER
jgi:hypothetical protein